MKLIRKIAWGVLGLTALMLWSAVVRHVSLGGDRLGMLSEPIRQFAGFPALTRDALASVNRPPIAYMKTPSDFQSVNQLQEDIWTLITVHEEKKWEVQWRNLRTHQVHYRWNLDHAFYARLGLSDYKAPTHSYQPKPYELIVSVFRSGTVRLDSSGAILWHYNQLGTHHSMNPDEDGGIWTSANRIDEAGKLIPDAYSDGYQNHPFLDEWIVQLDVHTGAERYRRSLTALLQANGLGYLLDQSPDPLDPYHMNDVQPVLEDGPYMKKGDLLVSLRNLSLILQVRPATDSIIRIIRGPFTFQHDVDILSDHEISLFDNHPAIIPWPEEFVHPIWEPLAYSFSQETVADSRPAVNGQRYSRVWIYDFSTDTFRPRFDSLFREMHILSNIQGVVEWLPNGDMLLEEFDMGAYWVLGEGGIKLKRVIPTEEPGFHQMPHWIRVTEAPPGQAAP